MLRQLFMILTDAAGNAFALTKVLLGDALDVTTQAMAVFAFKDKDGNAAWPQLNAEGAVVVTNDPGVPSGVVLTHLAAAQTTDQEDLAGELLLDPDKDYGKTECQIIGTRDSLWRLELVTEEGAGGEAITNLGHGFTGPGESSEKLCVAIKNFSTLTAPNKLRLYMTPLDKESDAYANLSTNKLN